MRNSIRFREYIAACPRKWKCGRMEKWGMGNGERGLNAEAQSGREAESFLVQATVGGCGIV